MTELVGNNIKYDYALGVGGARFFLFPLKDYHTEEDVKRAKAELRRDHDVLSINSETLEWEKWKELTVWIVMRADQNKIENEIFHNVVYEEYKKKCHKDDNEEK